MNGFMKGREGGTEERKIRGGRREESKRLGKVRKKEREGSSEVQEGGGVR